MDYLLAVTLFFLFLRVGVNFSKYGTVVAIIFYFLMFVNFGRYNLFQFFYSLFGYASVSLFLYLLNSYYPFLFKKKLLSENELFWFTTTVFIFGLLAMANTFNLHEVFLYLDLYSFGYDSDAWIIAMLMATICSLFSIKLSLFWTMVLSSWHFGLTSSNNMFDYVVDLFAFTIASYGLLVSFFNMVRKFCRLKNV